MALRSSPLVVAWVAVSLVALGGQREGAAGVDARASPAGEGFGAAGAPDRGPGEADAIDEGRSDLTEDEGRGDFAADAADDPVRKLATADGGAHAHRRGSCPRDMVRVRDFCVDRFEAPNRRGGKPLVMQSAIDAETWCVARRRRLCTEDEWIAACEGDQGLAYPYGQTHVDDRCNDDRPWRTVDGAKLAKWPGPEGKAHVDELYQADPSGARSQCESQAGVYDLTGNVEEWVVRTRPHANSWPDVLIGCYWSGCYGGGKPTCRSTNNAHGPEFRFYETGFRCCRDAGAAR